MKKILILIIGLPMLLSCNGLAQQTNLLKTAKDPTEIIIENERKASEKSYDQFGKLISTISFKVRTENKEDFKKGIIPWASIEKAEEDILNLIDKDKIVVTQTSIKIIIDYPLTNQYEFTLNSENGFSRMQLLREISKHYYMIYDEEEKSATVNTIPVEKRTTMYNRNQTNGRYGIWGHDISDLVLADIFVYKAKSGQVILTLNIES